MLLGMLAVVVTVRIGSKSSDSWNILGIGYNVIAIMNILITAWVIYTALIMVYISDDLSRRWTWLRRICRYVALAVALETPLLLLWVMVITPGIFLIPSWLFGLLLTIPFFIPIIYLYITTVREKVSTYLTK